MVSRPVAQKLDGTMIYDVLDTGQQALPGSGIRPDKTNIEIRFHNDNAYNDTPPDYVGLLCLRQAQSGGHSRVLSFQTVHNRAGAHREHLPGCTSRSGSTASANSGPASARSLPRRSSRMPGS